MRTKEKHKKNKRKPGTQFPRGHKKEKKEEKGKGDGT